MAINSKIWKLRKDSKAFITVKDSEAFMTGSDTKFVKVNKAGTTIYGPLSIVAGEESIKTAGMFSRLPDLVQMIPETMTTPGPHIKVPVPPIHVGINLALDVGFFAALLVG